MTSLHFHLSPRGCIFLFFLGIPFKFLPLLFYLSYYSTTFPIMFTKSFAPLAVLTALYVPRKFHLPPLCCHLAYC